MTDYSVKRAYRGQVLVAAPGAPPMTGEWLTSKDKKRYFKPDPGQDVEPYGRSSSAGANLKGGGDGLATWKAAMAAIGVVMSSSARSDIASLINAYDGDPYYKGDDGGSESGKSRLMKAVEKACETAGASSASSLGSEFHHLAELSNKGVTPRIVQEHLREPLKHYVERVAPIEFLHQEILIINDEIKRAGSVDYLFRLPAGLRTPDGILHDEPIVCVGDLKTGKWDAAYPAGVTAQLAAYGLGFKYDQENNVREPLHEDASSEWGVLVHYPLTSKEPRVNFYWVDLSVGLRAAKLNNSLDAMIAFFKSSFGKPVQFELESS